MEKTGVKWIGVAGLAALLLAGCRSQKNDIVFSDGATIPRLNPSLAASEAVKSDSVAALDERKIDGAVFSNLLTRHFWNDAGYSAIFLSADDTVVADMEKAFAGRQPPVKESSRADVRPDVAPRDKDTGKPAMILSVDIADPAADGSVTAIGKWFAGGAVAGFYSYQLKRTGDDWVIQNSP